MNILVWLWRPITAEPAVAKMSHLLFKNLQLNTKTTSHWILKSSNGFRNAPHPEKIIFLLHKSAKNDI